MKIWRVHRCPRAWERRETCDVGTSSCSRVGFPAAPSVQLTRRDSRSPARSESETTTGRVLGSHKRCRGPGFIYAGWVPVTCDFCGTAAPADEPPLTWTSSVENGKRRLFCERCSRENLRAIEGKLDSEWW
jgi:hypothetical protein